MPPSWTNATAVEKIDSNTYSCDLLDDWCIGTVPNGGYVVGCIMEVISKHFSTTLAKQNQPHTIALHVEFLRRTQTGTAVFKIDDLKIGRQTSVVHVHMSQDGREEIVAYVTNSNMDIEEGVSFDTGYALSPPTFSVDLSKLEQDADENWKEEAGLPFTNFRKAIKRLKWFLPRNGAIGRATGDQWFCFSDGSNFTDSGLAFAADMLPHGIEFYKDQTGGPFWYPTLLLNLDIKKPLPPGGVKWLFNRTQMKKIQNGRMDIEVHIFDAEGELVALSHHVALAVSASRNTSERSKDVKL
ncbi:hypothetical protein P154DRAFT_460549 [Amniculicola lignicola CBS 123094]|uniref:Thioesterase family protein n=1 Tax=Amniculicola lignicola CBS 123094 TaxID=1392246 RepID=A0A6A5WNE2_9PLEO|nr:hypothetical protein P154DRAFT_460549 [Amniculicola lignicola CBS 123094]